MEERAGIQQKKARFKLAMCELKLPLPCQVRGKIESVVIGGSIRPGTGLVILQEEQAENSMLAMHRFGRQDKETLWV